MKSHKSTNKVRKIKYKIEITTTMQAASSVATTINQLPVEPVEDVWTRSSWITCMAAITCGIHNKLHRRQSVKYFY